MTKYYISTSGLDSNSGLTSGDPFLTINKFFTVATGGDECEISGGIYQEDSGSGYLDLTDKNYSSEVHVYSLSGDATIMGTSGLYNIRANKGTIQNIKFSDISFESQPTGTYIWLFAYGGTVNNLTFSNCSFATYSGVIDLDAAFSCAHSVSGLRFEDNCSIDTTESSANAIYLRNTSQDCYFDLSANGSGYGNSGFIRIKQAAGSHTWTSNTFIECTGTNSAINYETISTGNVSIEFEDDAIINSSGGYACIISGGVPDYYLASLTIGDDVEFSGDGGLLIKTFVENITIGSSNFYSNSTKPALEIKSDSISGEIHDVTIGNITARSESGIGAIYGTNLENLIINNGEYSGIDNSLVLRSDNFDIEDIICYGSDDAALLLEGARNGELKYNLLYSAESGSFCVDITNNDNILCDNIVFIKNKLRSEKPAKAMRAGLNGIGDDIVVHKNYFRGTQNSEILGISVDSVSGYNDAWQNYSYNNESNGFECAVYKSNKSIIFFPSSFTNQSKMAYTIPSNTIAAYLWTKPFVRNDNTTLINYLDHTENDRDREPGRCLKLTKASSQYVLFSGGYLSRTSDYSVIIYFKVEDAGISATYPLFESVTSTSDRNGAYISASDGKVAFGYYNGTSYTGLLSNITGYNEGAWHCAIFINESGTLFMYIDGVDVGSSGSIGNLSASQIHRLGYFSNGSHYMNGYLSHYIAYDRILTSDEIQLFSEQKNKSWAKANIPTDNLLWYFPLEGEDTVTTFNAEGTNINGILQNYSSGMIYTGNDVPFSYENLYGYGIVYKYNGSNNYHTTSLNGGDIPDAGSAEYIFTINSSTVSSGYYSGMQGASGAGRFYFGVNGTGAGSAANRVCIGFKTVNGSNLSQGSSNIIYTLGHTYGLKAIWDSGSVTLYIDTGSGYSSYRTLTYSGSFESRDILIAALDNNGSIGNYCPFTVHLLEVKDVAGNILYSTRNGENGYGSPTNSPSTIRVPVSIIDGSSTSNGTKPEYIGPAPFDAEISGWDGSSNILISGQEINFNIEPDDPYTEYLILPTGYVLNGDAGSLSILTDEATREMRFSVPEVTVLNTLSIGNSLTEDFEPRYISERAFKHISTNTEMETIVAAPTTNLTVSSHRWDLALNYDGIDYDAIIVEPFTADTPYTSTTSGSPTYGGERDAIQTIIDSGTEDAIIVLYTGFNRKADHITDYSYTGTFTDSTPMVYCPTFFNQMYQELLDNNPDKNIRLADMLGAMNLIFEDIGSGISFYSSTNDLYRDSTHLQYTPDYSYNTRRLAHNLIRRTLNLPIKDSFPFDSTSGDEVIYQNAILSELLD